MIKLAVIGHPIAQSLSSVMHNAVLKEMGIDGEYETLDTEQSELVDRIKQMKSQGYAGFNVTIPLKVPITLFIDEVDEIADIAGCVNTVKILPNKSLFGYNTDVYGFMTAIPEDVKNSIKGASAAILGTGGAARAAAIGLCRLGVKEINFYARNVINASKMVNFLREKFYEVTFNLKQLESMTSLENNILLVNTTPVGMKGHGMGLSPIDEKFLKTLPEGAVVYDIIYNPLKTELLSYAQKNGYRLITGLDMFVHQGAKAFEIWTGKKPKIETMKIAALEALNGL